MGESAKPKTNDVDLEFGIGSGAPSSGLNNRIGGCLVPEMIKSMKECYIITRETAYQLINLLDLSILLGNLKRVWSEKFSNLVMRKSRFSYGFRAFALC